MKLRDYQEEAVEKMWAELFKESSALCVLPCGGGKTEVMIALIKKCIEKFPSIKIVTLVNKVMLLEQTYRRFGNALGFENIGMFCGSESKYQINNQNTVATIQSIYKVPIEKVNLIVLDEVHNVDQESGRYFDFIESHKKLNPKLKIIAFTATPFRSSGFIYGKDKLFKSITFQKKLLEMIERGYLVPPKMKRVNEQFDVSSLPIRMGEFDKEYVDKMTGDEKKVTKQILDALPRVVDRKKVVWACSSINHCEMVNEKLKELGEHSVLLHSKMESGDREASKFDFEGGLAKHMVFVSIVSEGYDYPPIDTIVLMRPMRSPVLYVQTVGRGLRLAKYKKDLLVLDYGKVVETVGPLDNPKLVKKGERSKKTLQETEMKFCPKCLSYINKTARQCIDCGYEFIRKLPKLDNVASSSGILLSKPELPREVIIDDVELKVHKSQNGNLCLKIDYYSNSILGNQLIVSEFFVWNVECSRNRMQKRLIDLDVDFKPTLNEQAEQKFRKRPITIKIVKDGKYMKVLNVRA